MIYYLKRSSTSRLSCLDTMFSKFSYEIANRRYPIFGVATTNYNVVKTANK